MKEMVAKASFLAHQSPPVGAAGHKSQVHSRFLEVAHPRIMQSNHFRHLFFLLHHHLRRHHRLFAHEDGGRAGFVAQERDGLVEVGDEAPAGVLQVGRDVHGLQAVRGRLHPGLGQASVGLDIEVRLDPESHIPEGKMNGSCGEAGRGLSAEEAGSYRHGTVVMGQGGMSQPGMHAGSRMNGHPRAVAAARKRWEEMPPPTLSGHAPVHDADPGHPLAAGRDWADFHVEGLQPDETPGEAIDDGQGEVGGGEAAWRDEAGDG